MVISKVGKRKQKDLPPPPTKEIRPVQELPKRFCNFIFLHSWAITPFSLPPYLPCTNKQTPKLVARQIRKRSYECVVMPLIHIQKRPKHAHAHTGACDSRSVCVCEWAEISECTTYSSYAVCSAVCVYDVWFVSWLSEWMSVRHFTFGQKWISTCNERREQLKYTKYSTISSEKQRYYYQSYPVSVHFTEKNIRKFINFLHWHISLSFIVLLRSVKLWVHIHCFSCDTIIFREMKILFTIHFIVGVHTVQFQTFILSHCGHTRLFSSPFFFSLSLCVCSVDGRFCASDW